MDFSSLRRARNRPGSQASLQTMIIKPNIPNSKVMNSNYRTTAFRKTEKTELNWDKNEFDKGDLNHFVSELEVRLGFCIPKQSLQQVSEFLRQKLEYKVNCSVSELHQFSQKLNWVLINIESFELREWNIDLAGQNFKFIVNNQDTGLYKHELSDRFVAFEEGDVNFSSLAIPDSIINFCHEYEEALQSAFIAHTEQSDSKSPQKTPKKSVFLINSEIEHSKKRKREVFALQQDLEWQKEELKFVLSHTKYQKYENLNRRFLLEDQLEEVRRHRISLAQEQDILESQYKKISTQKQGIRNIFLQLSKFLQVLENKSLLQSLDILNEISELESQVKALESRFKTCGNEESDSIHTQIYRVKTKISSLKSVKAINSSVNTSSNANTLMNNFKNFNSVSNLKPFKALSIQSSPSGVNLSIKIPKDHSSLNFSFLKTERSLSMGFLQSDSKDEEAHNFSLLKQKEKRLIEKEEELSIIEEKIINRLGKSDKINDLKILKAETARMKKRFESRQKDLEFELSEVEKYKKDLKEKEKELDSKFTEVDDEMTKVEQEKARVAKVLEDIKDYLQGRIYEVINDC